MAKAIVLKVNRDYYCIADVVADSISVGELKRVLENYDDNERVVFSNDNGYTYGCVNERAVSEKIY